MAVAVAMAAEREPRWRPGKIINGGAKFFANTFSRLINFGSALAALPLCPTLPVLF
ncbi:hypothetical protein M5D96_010087, partial [Drosophila gunungcola]